MVFIQYLHTENSIKQYTMINLKSIQTEIDASFLYALLAEHEEDENVAKVFVQMSAIELSHAEAFARRLG